MPEASLPTVAATGRYWRILAPRWAHQPLSGAGAEKHGGRFNRPGVATLYLSADLMTAVAEYEQDLGIRPGTFCAYDVDGIPVVDLRDEKTAVKAGIGSRAELFAAWRHRLLVEKREPPSWRTADRLRDAGTAGVLVPSTQLAGGTNLVLWLDRIPSAGVILPLDPQNDLFGTRSERG